jgi:hypothetical protein
MLKKFPNFSSIVDVGKFPGDLSEIPQGRREFLVLGDKKILVTQKFTPHLPDGFQPDIGHFRPQN